MSADTAPCGCPCRFHGSPSLCVECVKEHLLTCPERPKPAQEPAYPCEKCGKPRTKAEGGTTFTVCDECWHEDKLNAEIKSEIEALKAERDEWRDKAGLHQLASEAHKTRAESLEATYRAALEDATIAEYMVQALDEEPSDFAQSFEPVRRVLDLRAEVARLEGLISAITCDEADAKACERYCSHGYGPLHAEARAIRARQTRVVG